MNTAYSYNNTNYRIFCAPVGSGVFTWGVPHANNTPSSTYIKTTTYFTMRFANKNQSDKATILGAYYFTIGLTS